MAMVPPNCTNHLQPLGVSVNNTMRIFMQKEIKNAKQKHLGCKKGEANQSEAAVF